MTVGPKTTDVSGNCGKAETTGKFENWSLEAGNTVTCRKKQEI